jgi:hypothetical protein
MAMLEKRWFTVLGRPHRWALYGETSPGWLAARLIRRWADPWYPFWKEATTMAKAFRRFGSPDELPGEGVISMEFAKK